MSVAERARRVTYMPQNLPAGASLDVMESDTKVVRGNRPYILTNCKTGHGIEALVDMIEHMFLFAHKPSALAAKAEVTA